jgi:hypothetical protein
MMLWNAMTGNAIRQFEPDWPFYWKLRAVIVSNNADWTLAVTTLDGDWASAQLLLWDPAGRRLSSDKFKVNCDPPYMSDWSLSFTSGGHSCALSSTKTARRREIHEWTIWAEVVVKLESVMPTNDLPSLCIDAGGT